MMFCPININYFWNLAADAIHVIQHSSTEIICLWSVNDGQPGQPVDFDLKISAMYSINIIWVLPQTAKFKSKR